MSAALFTARALVDELCRAGVHRVCIAPGSRSTALALAVAERDGIVLHVLTDERSMGFFALGLARATRLPVALVCTSGTAAANLLPAVAEAAAGGGALVVLSADRPAELRDCAAPQTIDQVGLFGSHARWSVDVPILDSTPASARVLRSIAARAAAVARAGLGGPVHLNVPAREPFTDESFPLAKRFDVAARDDGRPFTSVADAAALPAAALEDIAARLSAASRGVLVCAGPELEAAPVAALACALGWPVVADPMSGLRFGPHDRSHVACSIEPLLRDEAMRASLRPDCILRLGLTPAPRSVQRWLEEAWPAEHIVVAPGHSWPDPFRAASLVVHADPAQLCEALAPLVAGRSARQAGGVAWLDRWREASATAGRALDAALETEPVLFDAAVLRAVADALPGGANLFVGNSMPVRDADAFLGSGAKRLHVFASRGASGIDGVLSTALGVAAAAAGPTALVVGDLSFLHDASALAFAAREHIPLLIVVVNNDGGGIFSYLPLRDGLAAGPDPEGLATFERLFATPHGTDLEQVASPSRGFFARVGERTSLRTTIQAGLEASAGGPAVVEVRTDRDAGRTAQLAIVRAAQAAVLDRWKESRPHAADDAARTRRIA